MLPGLIPFLTAIAISVVSGLCLFVLHMPFLGYVLVSCAVGVYLVQICTSLDTLNTQFHRYREEEMSRANRK